MKAASTTTEESLRERAFFEALDARRVLDPLVGAKLASKEISLRISEALTTSSGIHAESLFCLLGALAGHACQWAVRAQARSKGLDDTALMVHVKTADGRLFFMGDSLNATLYASASSVWNVAAAEVSGVDGAAPFDVQKIVAHVESTVGTPRFGIPRVAVGDLPAH